ncbi:MAG: hypothetical protein H7330_05435 [Hymenobacteraceae bacterium]|nr:hypothetical protein [Hymenobacteraceae bacterium]
MPRLLFFPAVLLLVSSLTACSNMQVATGNAITPSGTPGSPTAPIQSDADRQAVYNQSRQGVVPSATPRTSPLNQQASDINSRKLIEVPANQSPNLTPEQRTQQQTPQPLPPRP